MAVKFTDVFGSKYVLLTTFTTDGRLKPTPIRGKPRMTNCLCSPAATHGR